MNANVNPMMPWDNAPTNNVTTDQTTQTAEVFRFPWDTDEISAPETPAEVALPEKVEPTTEPAPTFEPVTEIVTEPVVESQTEVVEETAETINEPVAETVSETVETAEPTPEESVTAETEPKEEAQEEVIDPDFYFNGKLHSVCHLPAGDCSFQTALDKLNVEELEKALAYLKERPSGNKTRISAIEARIKKLQKGEDKQTDTVDTADIKAENDESTDSAETAEAAESTDSSDEDTSDIPTEPIFKEDEFTKINQQDLADKDKAILYMINHYHINPNLLNSLLEGNFENAWADISSMNKENMTVKTKLEKELKGADDSRLKVAEYLLDKATKEPEFAIQILLEHKEFERCYKYITDKVRETYTGTNPECVQVDDDKVYQWAVDYYNLDDFEQVMAERKAEEERKKKAAEAKAKKGKKKTTTTKAKSEPKKADTTAKTEDKKSDESKTNVVEIKTTNPDPVVPPTNVVTADNSNEPDPNTPIEVKEMTKEEEKAIKEYIKEKETEDKKDEELKENIAVADHFGQYSFNF